MDAVTILDQLGNLGVSVRVADDRLRLEPGSRVPPELLDELKAHKQEIILKLKGYCQKYPGTRAADQELAEIDARVRNVGYALLYSNRLQGLVAFYRDETAKANIPPGFATYSLAELTALFGRKKQHSEHELRLIHEAKKQGAKITRHELPSLRSGEENESI